MTGPESTGKTTLAQRLAAELGVPWVPEGSRLYAERIGRPLTVDDVEPIAREHLTLAAAAEGQGSDTIVLDTDLVSTAVYGRYYYGFTSEWVESESRARQADLYLLCDVDVPWVPDGIRDRPAQRESIFDKFAAELRKRRAHFVVVRGDWDVRWEIALEAVRKLDPVKVGNGKGRRKPVTRKSI